ncbi:MULTISPECIES: GNAT family N-acetyltransferase [unclassified Agrococcus]|uniref:GNAT family N-acetyltransferase n=1 Tax=unclassified Agrococcus TaxID=2615065 RepID=UPI00360FE1D6
MLTLHDASPDDADARALLDAYIADRVATWADDDRPYQPKTAPTEQLTPPNGALLVARLDGVAVGVGGVRRIPSDEGAWFEVKHLFATQAARGHSVGKALLAALEQRAIELGATDVVLDTNSSLAAAGGLYAAAGFASVEPFNDNPNANAWYAKRVAR